MALDQMWRETSGHQGQICASDEEAVPASRYIWTLEGEIAPFTGKQHRGVRRCYVFLWKMNKF
ncbi:hypothetical protein Plhal304r1_c008g0031551 [Plasmopara halstedii]